MNGASDLSVSGGDSGVSLTERMIRKMKSENLDFGHKHVYGQNAISYAASQCVDNGAGLRYMLDMTDSDLLKTKDLKGYDALALAKKNGKSTCARMIENHH